MIYINDGIAGFERPLNDPVEKASGGTELLFRWSDVAGAAEYALFSDPDPAGPFGVEVGTAASGAAGITLPMPAESTVYYLVAGRNPTCGLGPLR